jgi:hypothetical protein
MRTPSAAPRRRGSFRHFGMPFLDGSPRHNQAVRKTARRETRCERGVACCSPVRARKLSQLLCSGLLVASPKSRSATRLKDVYPRPPPTHSRLQEASKRSLPRLLALSCHGSPCVGTADVLTALVFASLAWELCRSLSRTRQSALVVLLVKMTS